ncbi:DUF2007 domain-containing protein [uncultured Roseivirga sp.]|uniref:putative signal transducing protein n=1 Tax=uncultured Roseivirga sp. TaxID=543088 RepID=UPI0030D90516|tara:strand:- start:11417 stop:11644 length:228 start_codon:yes stop_codon:yes gene_type:complete
MSEYVKTLTDRKIIINRISQLLDEEKIPYLVKDNAESARLAGFGTSSNDVDLYVYKSDFNKTETIIKSFVENSNE